MCGISGVVTGTKAALEACKISSGQSWRGTSSTGVAYPTEGHINIIKNLLPPTAFLKKLEPELAKIDVKIAIGHNRWPSVGEVTRNNAHPFLACSGEFALVHNGTGTVPAKWIKQLAAEGHVFQGDTDSEIMTHAIEELRKLSSDWVKVLEGFYKPFNGVESFAILVLTKEGEIWGIRNSMPIAIAQVDGSVYIASCEGGLAELDGKKVKLFEPNPGTVFRVQSNGAITFWGKFSKEKRVIHKPAEYKTTWAEWGEYTYDHQRYQNWQANQRTSADLTEKQVDLLMDEWMQQNNKGKAGAVKEQIKTAHEKHLKAMPTWEVCNLCHMEYWGGASHFCNGAYENKPQEKNTYVWCDKCELYDVFSHAKLHSGKKVSPYVSRNEVKSKKLSREELFAREAEDGIEVDEGGYRWKWNSMKGHFDRIPKQQWDD